MIRTCGLAPLAFVLATFAAVVPAKAAEEQMTREEIEGIVRDYLMREPEIVYEAIQELQRRQDEAEAERQQAMLVAHADQIFQDERDPVSNSDGDVTVVEFFDYRCGYCRRMTAGLEQLVNSDEAPRFVFKEFPILGEESIRAAQAALAANMQGGYEPMHFALMATNDLSIANIKRLASDMGLDPDQLEADMASEKVAQHIQENIQLARTLGISGTPSFIIEDRLVPGAVPVEQIVAWIAEERRTN